MCHLSTAKGVDPWFFRLKDVQLNKVLEDEGVLQISVTGKRIPGSVFSHSMYVRTYIHTYIFFSVHNFQSTKGYHKTMKRMPRNTLKYIVYFFNIQNSFQISLNKSHSAVKLRFLFLHSSEGANMVKLKSCSSALFPYS